MTVYIFQILFKDLEALYDVFTERNNNSREKEESACENAILISLKVYKDLVREKLQKKIRHSTEDLSNLHKNSKEAANLQLKKTLTYSAAEHTIQKHATNLDKVTNKFLFYLRRTHIYFAFSAHRIPLSCCPDANRVGERIKEILY